MWNHGSVSWAVTWPSIFDVENPWCSSLSRRNNVARFLCVAGSLSSAFLPMLMRPDLPTRFDLSVGSLVEPGLNCHGNFWTLGLSKVSNTNAWGYEWVVITNQFFQYLLQYLSWNCMQFSVSILLDLESFVQKIVQTFLWLQKMWLVLPYVMQNGCISQCFSVYFVFTSVVDFGVGFENEQWVPSQQ